MIRRKRSLMMISEIHRKHPVLLNGNMIKMPFSGYDYQRRKIKDWNSGRRSHLQWWPTLRYLEIVLIMWHLKIPGDCIDHVTSQIGERVNFERLETPRPASCSIPTCSLNKEAEIEHWAGAQDVSDHSTKANLPTKNPGQTTSNYGDGCSSQKRSDRGYSLTSRSREKMQKRIHKWLKDSKLVRTKSDSWRPGEGEHDVLAKNRAKISAKW